MNYDLDSTEVWTKDPNSILKNFAIIPSSGMSKCEQVNTITRLVIVIAIIMIIIDFKDWYIFLVIAIIIVAIMGTSYCGKESPCGGTRVEGFSLDPTYACGAQPFTTVPPVLGSEWQSPPPAYNEYTNIETDEMAANFQSPGYLPGQCPEDENFPIFTEYITSSNLRPFNEEQVNNTSLKDATLYMNDIFTSSQLEYRNNMSRVFVNKINRNYGNGFECVDQVSPTY